MAAFRRFAVHVLLAVAGIAATSCDRSTEPGRDAASMRPVNPGICATQCIIANDPRPFQLARTRRDTADATVPLARIEVSGTAGSTITLRAVVTSESAVPGRLDVVVTIDGRTQIVAARDLLRGVAVYRFADNRTIVADYALRSGAFALATTPPALVQELGDGAFVVSALRHWMRTSTSPRLIDEGRCYLPEPGTHCGFQVDIVPYQPVGDEGFENTITAFGQSYPVRINFAEPVKDLVVMIGDPDFAGNYATITTAGGSVTQEFAYDGAPGRYSEDDVYFPEEGIVAVDLIPPTGDWVYYFRVSFVGKDHIKVVCSPNSVERIVQPLSCTAQSSNSQHTVQVNEWKFTGKRPHEHIIVTEQLQANSWGGPLAATGTISAAGVLSNGIAVTGGTNVKAQPRGQYSQLLPEIIAREDPEDDLPDRPDSVGKLAHTHVPIEGYAWVVPGYYGVLPAGGPASGLHYWTQVPLRSLLVIHMNRTALSVGSEFWTRQNKKRIGEYCSRDDVVPFIAPALAHEGPLFEPQSHTRYFRDYANNNAAVFTERVVSLNLADFEARSNATVDSVVKKAAQEAHKADLFPVPYCTFRYF